MQFFESGIVEQLEFVYKAPLLSGTQCPLNKSHSGSNQPKPQQQKTNKSIEFSDNLSRTQKRENYKTNQRANNSKNVTILKHNIIIFLS